MAGRADLLVFLAAGIKIESTPDSSRDWQHKLPGVQHTGEFAQSYGQSLRALFGLRAAPQANHDRR